MKPIVLCFSGFDPSGGAGIQADIESIVATGSQAMSVITALTSQNTQDIYAVKPMSDKWLFKQVEPILQEFEITAIKIGLCARSSTIKALAKIIRTLPNTPVILDPILRSGTGNKFATEDLAVTIRKFLLPLSTIITPNFSEINALSPAPMLEGKIQDIQNIGCENILLTNTDISGQKDKVTHQWFHENSKIENFTYPMLKGIYHGSGCTLSASLASYLAQKKPHSQAVKLALDYTWASLDKSCLSGKAQHLPNREI